jgi:hypothetical protein
VLACPIIHLFHGGRGHRGDHHGGETPPRAEETPR